MCRAIPCPILFVRASCIACHGSTAQQQSAFTLEYIVPYCRCVRDVPTLKMRVVLTISSKNDHCCILVQVACFFLGWDLALFFSLLYVRTSCVSRHPVSYIVSACLVSYCLLVRQQQRFHHPTLRTTSVVLVGCIKKSNITSKHDHCCILVHFRKKSYIVSAYLVSYCLLLLQHQRFEHPTLKPTSVLLRCIQNSTTSSKRVR